MSDKELNIKSSTIEKGLDLAKDFLGKLIFPAVEEVGLLMGDNIKVWRFKNQIRLLNNVENYVKEKNISTKKVPLKILLPLLENASLEEEPLLNEMWENLLINYIDSKQTFCLTVFPHILSNLSTKEVRFIKAFNLNSKILEIHNNYGIKEFIKVENNGTINIASSMNITNAEITNLVRLGLFSVINGLELHKIDRYGHFDIDTKYLNMTSFGAEFMKACTIK